jgi:hypothetical protein
MYQTETATSLVPLHIYIKLQTLEAITILDKLSLHLYNALGSGETVLHPLFSLSLSLSLYVSCSHTQ